MKALLRSTYMQCLFAGPVESHCTHTLSNACCSLVPFSSREPGIGIYLPRYPGAVDSGRPSDSLAENAVPCHSVILLFVCA